MKTNDTQNPITFAMKDCIPMLNDVRVCSLFQLNGLDSLCIYRHIVRLLKYGDITTSDNFYNEIGKRLNVSAEIIKRIICDFDLFEVKKGELPIAKELDFNDNEHD